MTATMVRYRRVRHRRTRASDLQVPRPYPKDGTPVRSWRKLSQGCVEIEEPNGTRRTLVASRFTWGMGDYLPPLAP